MARANGDVVITIGGDVSPLTESVTRAERTLGKLSEATKRSDAEFRKLASTSTEMQARIEALTGVTERTGKSAEKAAQAFEAFDKSKQAIDRLRASYDPLFAASKRYEAAVEQLDTALEQGVITQQQYAQMAQKLGASMLTAGGQQQALARGSGALTMQVQNASYQVGDFFVQIASGTGAMRAMSQQLPQLLGGFGMWGAIAGAAVAIGGALIPMFMGSAGGAEDNKKAIDRLSTSFDALVAATDKSKLTLAQLRGEFGQNAAEAQRVYQLMANLAKLDFAAAMTAAHGAITETLEPIGRLLREIENVDRKFDQAFVDARLKRLNKEFNLTEAEALKVAAAIQAMNAATSQIDKSRIAGQIAEMLTNAALAAGSVSGEMSEVIKALTEAALKGMAFNDVTSSGTEAEKQRLAAVEDQIEAFRQQTELSRTIARYGEDSWQAEAVRRSHVRAATQEYIAQRGLTGQIAAELMAAAIEAFNASAGAKAAADSLRQAEAAARGLAAAIAAASGFSANLDSMVGNLRVEIDALKRGADAALAVRVAGLKAEAEAKRNAAVAAGEDRLAADARLALDKAQIAEYEKLVAVQTKLSEAKKGGGKKGNDKEGKEFEKFEQSLMTEAELELLNFNKRLEQLQAYRDAELLTNEEYNAKLEALQQQHQDRMSRIDVYRYGDGLQKAGAFMGDMAAALQSGNERMQKVARGFAAAEALINAWRAYSQTIADPTLPWFAKLAAGVKVLAAGFAAVNAIKGGGGGRSAGGGASAAQPAVPAQSESKVARYQIQGQVLGPQSTEAMFRQINEGIKAGYTIHEPEWV